MLGKRFGKWIVNSVVTGKIGRRYSCTCDCGTTRTIPATTLRSGRSKQCKNCMYKMLYDPHREIGKKYGKWTVVAYVGMHRKLQTYTVKCDCGKENTIPAAELRAKKTKQCATCHNQEIAMHNVTHGQHKTAIYNIWKAIKQRCLNPKNSAYKYYGARGIKIHESWMVFQQFYKDVGPRPEHPERLTLDRIDNDGNYEPGNVRWVTHKENCQNRSKRNNPHKVPCRGKKDITLQT